MKAAVVFHPDQGPVFAEYPDPEPRPGEQLVQVRASAISHVVKSRASGKHYSFDGTLPFIAGIDGTGVTANGQNVYFAFPPSPWGSMAERVPVRTENCVRIPESLDSVTAAAMANPGMSAWAALSKRARFQAGETVLINGATGSAGQLAVQIARFLGAGKIIVTGRDPHLLARLNADEQVVLNGDTPSLSRHFSRLAAAGIDVVIDYLWGKSACALLAALAKPSPATAAIRFVQVGSLSGANITLPAALLRSSPLQLMGSGIGSLSMAELLQATGEMLQAAAEGGFTIATTPARLEDVATAWARDDSKKRTVFVIS